MATTEKRRISAQQLLTDIRAGMDGGQLKQKHGLSDRSLESVLRKLSAAGHLTEAEKHRLSASLPTLNVAPREDAQTPTLQKCPACDALLTSESPECPVCGVIVSKFVALREEGSWAPLTVQESDSNAGKRWLLICCLLAVVVFGAGYFLFWSKDKGREEPKAVAGKGGPQSQEKALKQSGTRTKPPAEKSRKEKKADKVPNIFVMNTGELLELKFASEGPPLGLSVTQGSGGVHFFETPDPNQGFKKFPPETDAKRYYDRFTLAGQTFLMITEGSNPPQIYLDANRNGDMTDDPGPFVGEGPSAAPNHYTLELPYKGEETAVPYRLWLFPSNMGGIRFYPKCYWEGQIELNGNPYKVVTFDGNADGDYSNDPVIIDADNDGKVADSERLQPGQSLSVAGIEVKLLAIAPSGRWVRLEY
ncbi:MAG: hypothetical protein HY913_09005 [Desulfomonile tiedjei]|nr:hypothetical protein [Desulfomonile tiedjei]